MQTGAGVGVEQSSPSHPQLNMEMPEKNVQLVGNIILKILDFVLKRYS